MVFLKSVHKERIKENADVFNFELTDEEIELINGINKNIRTGSDPDTFTF